MYLFGNRKWKTKKIIKIIGNDNNHSSDNNNYLPFDK